MKRTFPEHNREALSSYDFDETITRLKQSFEAENLLLIHEINTQQILKMAGIDIKGLRQLLFFHPRYMKLLLETNPAAIIEAPLKMVVMEDDKQRVILRYPHPDDSFGTYEGLEALGKELSALLERIVAAVRD